MDALFERNADTIGMGPGAYNTLGELGGLSPITKKTPVYSFGGKGVRRGPAKNRENVPGAGQYSSTVSLGRQTLSQKKTAAKIKFSRSTRDKQAKVFSGQTTLEMVVSPGPAQYPIRSTLGEDLPSFSFGPGDEIEVKTKSLSKSKSAPAVSKIRPPGPGAYNSKSSLGKQTVSANKTAPTIAFSRSQRSKYDKQYSGVSSQINTDPDNPAFTYAHNSSTFSSQSSSKKKSAPSFSFGAKANVDIRKPRPKHNHSNRRARTAPSGQRQKDTRDNYDWLYPLRASKKMASDYERALDGCDLSKSREYKKAPSFGFGSGRRFNDSEYLPQNAIGNPDSPGPVYVLPPTLGDADETFTGNASAAPSFSFPVDSSRVNPQVQRAEREQFPGPGTHNVQLSEKVDEMLREEAELDEEDAIAEEVDRRMAMGGLSAEEAIALQEEIRGQMHRQMSRQRRDPFTEPGGLTLRASHLKYGELPTKSKGPNFSFGTGNRVGRAKMYSPGPMNKDMEGMDSPGPNSRFRRENFGKTIVDNGTPVYSFGGKGLERNPVTKAANMSGPASIGSTPSFGLQSQSKNKTAAVIQIGSATRDAVGNLYTPGGLNGGFGGETPGPKYKLENSLNRQTSSQRSTAPNFSFGSSKRSNPENTSDVPGPGAYGGDLNAAVD